MQPLRTIMVHLPGPDLERRDMAGVLILSGSRRVQGQKLALCDFENDSHSKYRFLLKEKKHKNIHIL